MEQGQIWWLERPDEKRRPCLLLTRTRTLAVMKEVMVVPLTSNIRNLATEVLLGPADGLPKACAANLQLTTNVPKIFGTLASGRWYEICAALQTTIGC
jgi:mRNA interferase MazF